MVALERNSNENNAHFIKRLFTFFYTKSETKYQENFPEGSSKDVFIFWKIECYCFHKFFETNSSLLKIKRKNDYLLKLSLSSSYFALIQDHVASN